jgi:CHAD domain-containing protein
MNLGPALAGATVGPYLVEKLRSFDTRLGQVAPRVLSSIDDRDAVHDLRVALRRTRTLLEVARSVLGRFHVDEVRRALRDLQQATGALRDEEVLLELVGSLNVEHPDVKRWFSCRVRRERRLRRMLSRAIRIGELDRGRGQLQALLAFRAKPSRDRRLARFARRSVERACRRIEKRRAARLDAPEELHRLRIAYKRLRYTVEAFGDVLASDTLALAQPAARFQSRLGDLHDIDTTMQCVRRARLLSDAARIELLDALARAREQRSEVYAKELAVASIAPAVPRQSVPRQDGGSDSLRKISIR